METLPYVDFSLGVHSRSVARRVPVNGTIEVTRRCPLRCLHCYNNLPVDDLEARSNELTYEEHCRILDEISEAGCLWLLYTGGEIFARDDFLEIYTYAKKKGLIITLFSNGTLIDEHVADTLADWRPFSIEISIYGRTKDTFERITRVPGSYERCMRGIHLLAERGLPLTLKTMALTLNRHEVGDMKRFVLQDLGLEFKYDAMVNPRVDGSRRPLRLRLTPEEIVQLDVQDPRRREEWEAVAKRSNGTPRAHEQSDKLYQCGGGLTSFAIDPYGRMGVCTLSQHNSWDLRRGNFEKGWDDFLFQLRQKKISRPSKCLNCGIKNMCTMCPVNAELENDDPETPVDFFCHVSHLRAYALGLPVIPHGECDYCRDGKEYQRLMATVEILSGGAEKREEIGRLE
jgi:radical SAM protein with 4Fe4S-binding SPASM domain